MESAYVALDLETTGLNPERDDIIEIAAVKFRAGQVVDEFQTLVRCDVDLSLRVIQLTGIRPTDLVDAAPVETALEKLRLFVGSLPLVGHSVGHDLRFIQRYGVFRAHPSLDTFELATILLPGAGRYTLANLLDHLGLDHDGAHRALADAHAHRLLFEALVARAAALPEPVLADIDHLARDSDWSLASIFEAARRAQGLTADEDSLSPGAPDPGDAEVAGGDEGLGRRGPGDGGAASPGGSVLAPSREPVPISAGKLESNLLPGGRMAELLAGYEDRPGQREMLRHVAAAFNQGDHLLLEAGTGTGKTIAYLLPAAAWAVENGRHVVVATHTVALQQQLVAKDVPLVEGLLGHGLRVVVLKGRSHYLCRSRLASLRHRRDLDADALRGAVKILAWAHGTKTGDRAEVMLQPAEMRLWRSVSADGDACSVARCPFAAAGACWVHRARRAAEEAHLVIVNHALLISDMLVDNRLLPPHDRLIVDEAHHLEEVATRSLGFDGSEATLRELVGELSDSGRRVLPRTAAAMAATSLEADQASAIQDTLASLAALAARAGPLVSAFFSAVEAVHKEQGDGRSPDLRLTAAARSNPAWLEAEMGWDALDAVLRPLVAGLGDVLTALQAVADEIIDPGLPADLGGARRELAEARRGLAAIVEDPSPARVAWISRAGRQRTSLKSAPLHVGDTLARRLFGDKETLLLASATLRAGDGFRLVRNRLGLAEAEGIVVPSPFDYATSTLLLLPTDIPEPYHSNHRAGVARALIELGGAVEGRTLVLFTSHGELRDAYHKVRGPLGTMGVAVLGQGLDGSRHGLLTAFRDPEVKTMLLGTRSFWEGVDVPGESLSCLAIARLPFDVPTDPIFAARAETFEESFDEYAVPQAVLRLRQGFGRLIRAASDRGVVAILDRRILTKSYGQAFLDALPPARRQEVPVASLGVAARRFLSGPGPDGGPLVEPEGAAGLERTTTHSHPEDNR